MTKEEAKKFGLQLLHGIMERNESYPVYANNVKQAIDALSEPRGSSEIPKDLEEAAKEKEMEWGYNLCKEQMMKEAVEGEVENASFGIVYLRKNLTNDGYLTGDKVRVIVCKKED